MNPTDDLGSLSEAERRLVAAVNAGSVCEFYSGSNPLPATLVRPAFERVFAANILNGSNPADLKRYRHRC